MSDTDLQLLARYTRDRAEDAFAEIVRRHLDLVHSAALRQVRSPQLAEEVAQSAFTDLARNAHRLAPDTILTAWLYQVTRRSAIDVVRREARRQLREQIATEMNAMNATTADWTHIEPLLDEAMHALDETDRAAVLLRYFENKSLREVGATLGTSDDAAQKRVSRAVERLREFFAKRGVTVGASGLVVVISANAVQAAPVGLAVAISTAAAIAGTNLTTTATAIKTIAMTILQKTLITATLAAAVGAGIYEARQNSKLRDENESQQQQIAQLKMESESLSNRLTPVADAKSLPDEQFSELLRLRGEVGVLRRQKGELENSLANVRNSQSRAYNPGTEQQPPPALPDDYPKTADGATKGIFETWARGDWNAFFTNFAEPGVPREVYDQMFNDPLKSNYLAGLEIVSVGQPTNSFGPNMWFVPYKIRFKDGSEKEFRLHVAQDPRTQRWYFKGGF
jgi:RNA polymerase sigma factor (sigma-70 family)